MPYVSQLVQMSTRGVRYGVGFNNYREHTEKGTQELANSIKEVGLIEPITLHYDTINNSWDLIDGEGRFWGSVLVEAASVPVEIYYDVPDAVRQEMKLKLNSTKTRFHS